MNGLNHQFVEETKVKLVEEKNRLQARMEELKAQDPFNDPEHVNDNAANDTGAYEESGHDRMSALIEELATQLTAVESALLRIGDGSYGICSNCGKEIGEGRLKVNPTADKCMDCSK